MIRELTGQKGLFFPRRLINEIVRWLLGIFSPTGTIKISNTANPKNGQSMAIDVDVVAVAGQVAKRIGNRPLTANQRKDVCDVIRTHVDDVSIIWRDGGLAVNEEWIEDVFGIIEDDDEHTTDDITDWDTATSDFLTIDDFDPTDYYTSLEIDTLMADVLYMSDIGVTVAAEGHTHSEYAAANHTHSEYAAASHTHSEYAAANHAHTGYAASNHTHRLSEMTEPNCTALCFLLSDHGTLVHSNSNPSVDDVCNILSDYANGVILTTADIEDYYTADDVDSLLEDYITADEFNDWVESQDFSDVLYVSDIGVTVAAEGHTHSEYAAANHTHSEYAASNHTHSEYAAANHAHTGYAASNHTHQLSEMTAPGCTSLCFLLSDNGTLVHSNSNPSVQAVRDILADYDNGVILTTADIDPSDYYTSLEIDTLMADVLYMSDIGVTVAAEGHTHSEYAAASHTHTVSEITDFPVSTFSGTINAWLNGSVGTYGEVYVNPCQIVVSHGLITGVSISNRIQIV